MARRPPASPARATVQFLVNPTVNGALAMIESAYLSMSGPPPERGRPACRHRCTRGRDCGGCGCPGCGYGRPAPLDRAPAHEQVRAAAERARAELPAHAPDLWALRCQPDGTCLVLTASCRCGEADHVFVARLAGFAWTEVAH